MKQLIVLVLFTITLQLCIAPPVTKNKEQEQAHNDTKEEKDVLQDYMEYHRYLRQVVNALESDTDFRDKLEKADETDIKSGKIAHQLEFVSHHVRSRLDELKRTELARLKTLTDQKEQLTSGNRLEDPLHHHLDNTNPHTFEIEDLKRLIVKTTADLADADRQRRDEFKEYELQKEYEKQEKLNHTENGEERDKLEKEYKMEEQHKKHEPLHEPGHKAQFEEVWEEQDHMQQQDFDPKAFFMLHDLDGNKLWDQEEVKALFIKELDKLYQAGAPEDDMRERVEEMERMRESVFGEMDINRDGFIDYNEFIAQTQRKDYQQDNGWQGIDEQKPYTHEELEEYISKHHGMPDYQGGYYPPQGHPQGQPQYPPHPNDINYGQHQMPPNGQQLHPGQMPQVQLNPQQVYQQVPPQMNPQFNNNNPNNQQHLNTNEIYRNQPPPPPQQQQHPNAVPNAHYTNQQYQQNQQANNQQYHQQKQANHNQQYQQQQQQQVHYNQQQQKQPVVNQQQQQPIVNKQQPVANQQQPVANQQQQPVANQQQQPVVSQQQPIVNQQQQPIVSQQQPIVSQQQQPIVNQQIPPSNHQQNIPISNEIKS